MTVGWEAHYLPDVEYLVWYRPYGGDPAAVSVEFQAIKVVTFNDEDRPTQVERKPFKGMGDWVDLGDREESNVFVEGAVKWDGCSNINFSTDDCMKHFCGKQDAEALGTLLGHIYEIAWHFHFTVASGCCTDRELYEGH